VKVKENKNLFRWRGKSGLWNWRENQSAFHY